MEVRAEGFQGVNDVWFEVEEFERFLGDLRRFQESRQGSCHMRGMNPDEFQMTIEALDRTGHFYVAVDLRKYYRVGQLYGPFTVSAAWELDPTSLPRVIRDLAALLPPDT